MCGGSVEDDGKWDGGSGRSRRKDLRLGVQRIGSDVIAFLEVAVTLLFEG